MAVSCLSLQLHLLHLRVVQMCVQGTTLDAVADLCVQYAYSAWAPQFAQRLKLSKTESNLIVRARMAPL